MIAEKENNFKDAGDYFESSWKLQNQSAAAVGYKLAFNYLKAKRFVEAIDVSHKVLSQFPEYPKIKEEILVKARELLRP